MTVISDATTPEGREISVEVTPPPGSYALTIDARSQDGVHGISVNLKNVPEAVSGSPASVRVVAFSPERSLPVTISVPAGATSSHIPDNKFTSCQPDRRTGSELRKR